MVSWLDPIHAEMRTQVMLAVEFLAHFRSETKLTASFAPVELGQAGGQCVIGVDLIVQKTRGRELRLIVRGIERGFEFAFVFGDIPSLIQT